MTWQPISIGFAGQLGVGPRVRNAMTVETERRVGYPVAGIDVRVLARLAEPVPLLVVHDRGDRETSHTRTRSTLVETWRGPATLISTDGLGHRRLLIDERVIDETVRFVAGDRATSPADSPLSDLPSEREGSISANR